MRLGHVLLRETKEISDQLQRLGGLVPLAPLDWDEPPEVSPGNLKYSKQTLPLPVLTQRSQ